MDSASSDDSILSVATLNEAESQSQSRDPTWKRLIIHINEGNLTPSHLIETLFRVESRGSTLTREVYAGIVHFLSVSTILAVNPSLLSNAGYNKDDVATATAFSSGIACMLSGVICNFPFIVAPTLATGIYLSAYMQNQGLSCVEGNTAVFVFGILLVFCSIRQVTDFLAVVIPYSIKKGVVIGLSLILSLQALISLNLVVPSTFNLLTLGNFWTTEVMIAICSLIVIGVSLHHEVKGAYVAGLSFGAIVYWIVSGDWPDSFMKPSGLSSSLDLSLLLSYNENVYFCILDLLIIVTILLSGLSIGLADLAGISRSDGSAPRRRWLYFVCGIGTIISSSLGAGPLLLSAESAPGIIAGARTGLSVCVCGLLFFCSYFFFPVWAAVPSAGTAPVLLMVGLLLFENTAQIKWRKVSEALPVFITAVFCAFAYSILYGVIFGISMYIIMLVFTNSELHMQIYEGIIFFKRSVVKYASCDLSHFDDTSDYSEIISREDEAAGIAQKYLSSKSISITQQYIANNRRAISLHDNDTFLMDRYHIGSREKELSSKFDLALKGEEFDAYQGIGMNVQDKERTGTSLASNLSGGSDSEEPKDKYGRRFNSYPIIDYMKSVSQKSNSTKSEQADNDLSLKYEGSSILQEQEEVDSSIIANSLLIYKRVESTAELFRRSF